MINSLNQFINKYIVKGVFLKNVVRFRVGSKNSGAGFYESNIDKALNNYNGINYIVRSESFSRSATGILSFICFWVVSHLYIYFRRPDIIIISPGMLFVIPKNIRVICICHHYDPSVFKGFSYFYSVLAMWFLKLQSNKIDSLVTGAKFWKNYFEENGFKNIDIIYSAFDIDSMDKSLKINNNKILEKYGLKSGEYIHIGGYGEYKGQIKLLNNLREHNLTLVATSPSPVNVSSFNGHNLFKVLNLNFDEYNIVIKNSIGVVAMSEFKEGWCRVLHEAIIHGRPILGTGLGGMGELLDMANVQPNNFNNIESSILELSKAKVSYEVINKFRGFTVNEFQMQWIEVLNI
jgi:glycosyltransferase involved in cell wall biosynthesis